MRGGAAAAAAEAAAENEHENEHEKRRNLTRRSARLFISAQPPPPSQLGLHGPHKDARLGRGKNVHCKDRKSFFPLSIFMDNFIWRSDMTAVRLHVITFFIASRAATSSAAR